jgi:hypothetical protein
MRRHAGELLEKAERLAHDRSVDQADEQASTSL